MARDSYSGGGTIVTITDTSTNWRTRDEAAPPQGRRRGRLSEDNRRPTDKEIAAYEEEDQRLDVRLKRNFISQCAAAYRDKNLRPGYPLPPDALRKQVDFCEGNVGWLTAKRERQDEFHRAYCRLIGRKVPIEEIWNRR